MCTLDDKKSQKLKFLKQSYQNIPTVAIPVLIVSLFCLLSLSWSNYNVNAQNQTIPSQNQTIPSQNQTRVGPSLTDQNLKVELVVGELDFPTSMDFLGKDDILVLEKNTGKVYRIGNGNVTGPLVTIDVGYKDERGLLGIAVSGNKNSDKNNTSVYLYYTECLKKPSGKHTKNCGNYIYRYKFDAQNNKLVDPKLILTLPALPGPSHNGGAMELDKEKNLYLTTGDLLTTEFNQTGSFDTKAQNFINGTPPDGRAGILRLTQDGKPVGKGILGDEYPLDLYYAYGIKNSFGIGFDPVTNNLWDTENGPQFGDEINLVKPGFNSGWEKVQGIWKLNQTREKESVFKESNKDVAFVDFDGKGKYSDPEFVWDKPVAPTALIFLDSDKLGQHYQNDIFVGSAKRGLIYHFDLTKNREALDLSNDLADLVFDKNDESSKMIFGENFGVITDLEVGPDGYLYILSGFRGTDEGSIYRVIPNSK